MIYTRYGGEAVKIISGNIKTGEITIEHLDGARRTRTINDVVADDGIKEVAKAIKEVTP